MRFNISDPQLEILRRMTPAQRLDIALRLYDTAWEWKVATVRSEHPDWPEELIERVCKEAFRRAST